VIDTQVASDAEFLPLLPSERGASYAAGIAVGEEVAAAGLARAAMEATQYEAARSLSAPASG
jgi:hypothetical protein